MQPAYQIPKIYVKTPQCFDIKAFASGKLVIEWQQMFEYTKSPRFAIEQVPV